MKMTKMVIILQINNRKMTKMVIILQRIIGKLPKLLFSYDSFVKFYVKKMSATP